MTTSEQSWVFLCTLPTCREDFVSLAEERGWVLADQIEGDGQSVAFEQIRLTPDKSTQIHYLDDPVSGLRFIVVHGPEAGSVAGDLGRHLQVRTSINVVRMAKEARSERAKMDSAMELAVAFKQPDADAMKLLRKYYKGGSDPLRRRVIKALGYRGWPEAVELLEEIARTDASEELRGHAQNVAQLWRQHSGPKG